MQNTNFSALRVSPCFQLYLPCLNDEKKNSSEIDWCTENCTKFHRRCLNGSLPCSSGLDHELPTILLVTFILISVSSLLANGFVCVVYMVSKEIRTAKHYFIVNLSIADILIAVFAIPFFLTEYIKDESKTLCQIGAMVDVLCCTSCIVSFTVISIERFVAVKYPLRYRTIISRKRCLVVLFFVWAYSIAFSLASRIPIGKFQERECVFFTHIYIIFTTFASFVLPLMAMFVTYGWLYKVASRQARQINLSLPHTPGATPRTVRELKAIKTVSLIIGAFVVSWLPFFVYIWVINLYQVKVPFYELFYIIQVVRFLNGLANPFIYVGINRDFRRSTIKLLKRILPRKERSSSEMNNEYTQSTDIALKTASATSLSVPSAS